MKRVFDFLKRIMILSIVLAFTYSCCDKEDNYYYFPHGAIDYYNLYDSILFNDAVNGEFERYLVCERDTLLTVFDWGGWCGNQDNNYVISYTLGKDSCLSNRSFIVKIYPDTAIKIISSYPDGTNLFFNSRYSEASKSDSTILGITYRNVIQIESMSNVGYTLLFNIEYGIIQYEIESSIFNLINNEK